MMNYNTNDFRKFSDFEFNPFLELKGARVTDDRYNLEGDTQSAIVTWFKRVFQSK